MELEGWVVTVLLLLGGVVVLNHIGVDIGSAMAGTVHGVERLLGRPL
jgi:hypothetical protein